MVLQVLKHLLKFVVNFVITTNLIYSIYNKNPLRLLNEGDFFKLIYNLMLIR
nr:MAG TPA: hypothetical protein [Caudoviricetes sp.]DAX46528.1 MAG TPA: hypothetical protein [Caudoviricetes sp.]